MTYLILRLSTLGNVAMTVPVIATASRLQPNGRFVVVAKKKLGAMFYGMENVQYHEVTYMGVGRIVRLWRELQKYDADCVIDLQDVPQTQLLRALFRLQGKRVVAVQYGRWQKRKMLLRGAAKNNALPTEFDRYRWAMLRAGIQTDRSFEALPVNREAQGEVARSFGVGSGEDYKRVEMNMGEVDKMEEKGMNMGKVGKMGENGKEMNMGRDYAKKEEGKSLERGAEMRIEKKRIEKGEEESVEREGKIRRIGIAPFAKSKSNMLPYRVTKEVIEKLSAEPNTEIFLFGAGKIECEMLRQWSSVFPHTRSVAGILPLGQELELMRGLDVMICMDSANQHLSSLVGLRAVSVWCATHPKMGFMGWKQNGNDIIQRNDIVCRPCTCHGKNGCWYRNFACKEITADQILERL